MKFLWIDFCGLFKKEPLIVSLLILLCSGIVPTFATYAALLLLPILLYKGRISACMDDLFVFICLYSFIFSLFSLLNGFYDGATGNVVFQSCYPPLFYVLGRWLVKNRSQYIYMVLLLMIVLIAIPVILDVIKDINENQFINPLRQIQREDGTMSSSATLLGLKVSLSVACIGLLFSPVIDRKEAVYKYVCILFSLLGLLCVVHLINRTGLVVACVSILAVIFFNWKKIPFSQLFLLVVLFIGVLVFFRPQIEFSNEIRQSYEARDEGVGAVSTAGGRLGRWQRGIEDFYLHPLGYSNDGERRGYAHNFWLDTSATAGLLPFIFLIILTIGYLKRNYFLIIQMKQGLLRSLIIVCNVGFFLTCFVEPVMEGFMLYVFLLFFFIGITSQLYFNHRYSYIQST